MATIFEKLPASGEKCLILEPRESLFYPFDVGDYKEVRIAAFVSFTSESNNNSSYTTENISAQSIPKNNFFFGLKTNSFFLPSTDTGDFFIGQAGYGGVFDTAARLDASFNCLFNGDTGVGGTNRKVGNLSIYSGTARLSNANNYVSTRDTSGFLIASPTASSGSGFYAGIMGLRVVKNDEKTRITGSNFASASTYNDVSITNLSKAISSASFDITVSSSYNSEKNIDNIFIYSPFLNNKIRIHSILVEKWQ